MALSTDFTPLSLAVLPRRKRHPVVRALRALLGTAAVLALLGTAGWAVISQPGVRPIAPPQAVQGMVGNPATRSAQADRLQAHVKALSEDLPGRSFDQPAQLQRAADYVFAQMQQTGTQPIRQAFEVNGNRYENIVLRLGPAAGTPAGNAPLLVVGAHLDAARTGDVNPATGPNATSHTPGADDNASGVAGLLELARLLAQQAPSQPIELVAYTLEEPPQFRSRDMGSYRHAQGLTQRKQAVRLMLSLEMIGYYSDAPGSQRYPLSLLEWIYPTQGNFLGLIGQMGDFGAMRETKAQMRGALAAQPSDAPPLPIHSLNAPKQVHGVDFSDHLNYWHFGFPALMVTDTSFMRNPHYHQPTDTWATLDYPRMAQAVNAVLGVALAAPAAPPKTADIDPR